MNNPAQPTSPRRRLQELLAIPDSQRTEEQWDELNELEIKLAPGNREAASDGGSRDGPPPPQGQGQGHGQGHGQGQGQGQGRQNNQRGNPPGKRPPRKFHKRTPKPNTTP